MFNYIHETIVNDANGIHAITNGTSITGVVLERGGKYLLSNIVDKVYVSKGTKGKEATATFDYAAPKAGNFMRVTIFLSTPSTEFAEFAMPNWHEFGKPFVVETKADTIDTVVNALELSQDSGNRLFTVKKSTREEGEDQEKKTINTIVLTTTSSIFDFAEVVVTEFTPYADGQDEVTVSSASAKLVHAVQEFGTAKWIRENLRFPSGPNMRYTPLYADEAPVVGAMYNQYSFQYKVDRAAPGGLSGVNQLVTGISTQVIYVQAGSAAETKLNKIFNSLTEEVATSMANEESKKEVIDDDKLK